MFKPKFKLSNKILKNTVRFYVAHTEAQAKLIGRKDQSSFQNQIEKEDIHALIQITGTRLKLADADKIAEGKELRMQELPYRPLINYRSAKEYVRSAVDDKYVELDPELLLHINKIITSGWTETWEVGKFRSATDDVNANVDRWVPLWDQSFEVSQVRTHVFDILNWLKLEEGVLPLLKTAIVALELVRIAPFVSGNQLTILCTLDYLFKRSELAPNGVFPIAKIFLGKKETVVEKMAEAINTGDYSGWLEAFTGRSAAISEELVSELGKIEGGWFKRRKKLFDGLNERQLKVLKHLKVHPRLYRRNYVKMTGVSTMTAYRDLQELINRGLVKTIGKGRGTYYSLIATPVEESEQAAKKEPERMVFGSERDVRVPESQLVAGKLDSETLDNIYEVTKV